MSTTFVHQINSLLNRLASREHTLLLLETDRTLCEVLQEGLINAGFDVICANNVKHAAQICRAHGSVVDLLLANTNALGSRPLDCLHTIKRSLAHLPVLLISAYDRQALSERHADLLAGYEFLPIPFEFPHLTDSIHALLQLQCPTSKPPQGNGT